MSTLVICGCGWTGRRKANPFKPCPHCADTPQSMDAYEADMDALRRAKREEERRVERERREKPFGNRPVPETMRITETSTGRVMTFRAAPKRRRR